MDRIVAQFIARETFEFTHETEHTVLIWERFEPTAGIGKFGAGFQYLRLEDGRPVTVLGDGVFSFNDSDDQEVEIISDEPLALAFGK